MLHYHHLTYLDRGMHIIGYAALIAVKFVAALAAAFALAGFMGLPVNDPWFDVFMVYVMCRWALTSIVNGMPEPEVDTSLWYIWCYRTMHSMAHISTAYFSHRNIWKYIAGFREGGD